MEKKCGSCKFYLRHYTFSEQTLFRVNCGHCTYARRKQRKPDANACENYIAETQTDPFVTKEYLSRRLLEYVLSLDVLPEIEDATK